MPSKQEEISGRFARAAHLTNADAGLINNQTKTMTPNAVSIGQLQRGLSAWLNRAAYGQERVIVTSHNRPKVAMISIDDLCLLEDLEDAQAAREAVRAYRAGETVPWEQVEGELKHAQQD